MGEIMSNEADRVAFLQRMLGYALNGVTKEHILGVFVGKQGRNGKRVLFETLQGVLGPYAHAVQTDILIGQNHNRTAGAAQPHLMELQGKRIAYCSETGEQDKLSTAQVKNVTGGDAITARNLHENPITFMPSHTLFLQTNYKPQAPADDDALWERVKVIEFKERFIDEPDPHKPNEHPRDLKLEETLVAESSGILAWLVRGGLEWQKRGLQTPQSVRVARDTYRKEESIEPFLNEACVISPALAAEGGELYAVYQDWCKAYELRPKSSVWFGKQLGERFEKGRVGGKGRTCYYGLAIETTTFEPTTLHNSSHDSTTLHSVIDPSTMQNSDSTGPEVTRFCEGLASISKSSEHAPSHEGNLLDYPSHPSHPSQDEKREQPIDPYAVIDWLENPPRYTVVEHTDNGDIDLPGDYPTLEEARAATTVLKDYVTDYGAVSKGIVGNLRAIRRPPRNITHESRLAASEHLPEYDDEDAL